MSYYIVKVYGLVCDVCDVATEEHVPPIDEPHKLADTRRELSSGPTHWVFRDGKDLCAKCAAREDESAAAVRVNEQQRRPDRTGPVVLHRVDAASLLP